MINRFSFSEEPEGLDFEEQTEEPIFYDDPSAWAEFEGED